ncbi:MAG: hypothetical protein ONA90_03270, partial [candidate division KSB1 bacterium]|nr:hypothetical protein [candidate division KSB1 bacterium]
MLQHCNGELSHADFHRSGCRLLHGTYRKNAVAQAYSLPAGRMPNAANFSERQADCGKTNSKAMTKNEWQKYVGGFSSKILMVAW